MLILEAFLKFGSIGVMCALVLLVLRDARHVSTFRFALPLIATLICMLLTTGSDPLRLTGPLFIPLRLLDSFSSLFIWWFGLALFDDDFELGAFEWGVAALFSVIAIPVKLYFLGIHDLWFPGMDIISALIPMMMMFHLAYRAIKGRKEDLIEKRRRVRVWFAAAIAMVLTVSILAERIAIAAGVDSRDTIWITYSFTLPIVIWAVLWLTRLHPEALAFQSKPKGVTQVSQNIEPRDIKVHKKLVTAQHLDVPAHQLRALINRSMGYQNFAAFVNHYRIRDVKRALADPKNGRIPILTLAMDSGFSSLAPFNRAFKKSVGITPTEYRNNLLDETSDKAVQN